MCFMSCICFRRSQDDAGRALAIRQRASLPLPCTAPPALPCTHLIPSQTYHFVHVGFITPHLLPNSYKFFKTHFQCYLHHEASTELLIRINICHECSLNTYSLLPKRITCSPGYEPSLISTSTVDTSIFPPAKNPEVRNLTLLILRDIEYKYIIWRTYSIVRIYRYRDKYSVRVYV